MWTFDVFLVIHVVSGALGLVALWPPMLGRKGGEVHRRWGRVFAYTLLVTSACAVGMSLCTLYEPLQTHPKLTDDRMVRGLFGWMMLHLAVFTMSLAWFGLQCARHRNDTRRHRNPVTLGLQLATFLSALACAGYGALNGQPLMIGVSMLGLVTAVLNTRFIMSNEPERTEWLVQHLRALVGAGVSVYTAFFSFGAANLMPAIAFNPILWAAPTVLGVGVIGYHQLRVRGQLPQRHRSPALPSERTSG